MTEEEKPREEGVTETKTEEIKSISPLINQTILRMLGSGLSTGNGNDIYYYVRAVYMMIADLGESYVESEWKKSGRDWDKTKKNLKRLDSQATNVKSWYDALEDKKLEKKKKEIEIKKFYIRTASKIPILNMEFFDLLVFLLKKTPLHRQTIPSEAFKIIEHHGRKPLGMKDKKIPQAQSTEVSQESD